jgi:hypothetical protein
MDIEQCSSENLCKHDCGGKFPYNIPQASNAEQRDHKGLETDVTTGIVTRETGR